MDRSESVYYRNSGTVPFASRLSFHVRRKMFLLFMEFAAARTADHGSSTWA